MDVKVTPPIKVTTMPGAASAAGFALDHAHKGKLDGAEEACRRQGLAFLPLVAEPRGRRRNWGLPRPLSAPFLFLTSGKGTDMNGKPLWGRKSMGESIFHWEDGPPWGKMHPNWSSNMPRNK